MKIGLYAKVVKPEVTTILREVAKWAPEYGFKCKIHEHFALQLSAKELEEFSLDSFSTIEKDNPDLDLVLCIGGDGTILESLTFVLNSNVPVLGINTGRLGFLAATGEGMVKQALEMIAVGKYSIDKRSLLQLESSIGAFNCNFALNDFVIHKKESSSMITVHTYMNGEFMNSYWADGLIISTPTGSSGYSLSCGGPIIFPKSENFAITPIAPHNLNVRPVVVNDDVILSFEIEGRSNSFLMSLDARSMSVTPSVQLAIKKAPFWFNLIRLENENFLTTLRNKMNWGFDSRN